MNGRLLSPAAARVLAALRAAQPGPDPRVTDAQLAEACGLAHREIIDARRELLEAGALVLADGRGCWIGTPREGVEYIRALRRRGRALLSRIRAVRKCLLLLEGQRNLADPGPSCSTLRDDAAPAAVGRLHCAAPRGMLFDVGRRPHDD